MLALVTSGDGIPQFLQPLDGNASDQTMLPQVVLELTRQLHASGETAGVYVADSGLYCAVTMRALQAAEVAGVSRVPETSRLAQAMVREVPPAWQHSADGQLSWWGRTVDLPQGQERWLVVYSREGEQRARITLPRQVEREQAKWEKRWWHLSHRAFACAPDAQAALDRERQAMPPWLGARTEIAAVPKPTPMLFDVKRGVHVRVTVATGGAARRGGTRPAEEERGPPGPLKQVQGEPRSEHPLWLSVSRVVRSSLRRGPSLVRARMSGPPHGTAPAGTSRHAGTLLGHRPPAPASAGRRSEQAWCRSGSGVWRVPCAVCRVACAVCRVPSGPAQGQGGPRLTSWCALCQSRQQGIQPETTQLLAGKGAAAQAVLVGQALVLAPALQLAGHQRPIGVAVRQLLGQDVPRMPRRPPGAYGQSRQWPCLCPAQGPDGRTPCASEDGARQRSTPLRPAPCAVRGGPAW